MAKTVKKENKKYVLQVATRPYCHAAVLVDNPLMHIIEAERRRQQLEEEEAAAGDGSCAGAAVVMLEMVTRHDAGLYTCRGTNEAGPGPLSSPASLRVQCE